MNPGHQSGKGGPKKNLNFWNYVPVKVRFLEAIEILAAPFKDRTAD
jgi:hypothetical protein